MFQIGESVFLDGTVVDSVHLQGDEHNLCIEGEDGVRIWLVDSVLPSFGCYPAGTGVDGDGKMVLPEPEPEPYAAPADEETPAFSTELPEPPAETTEPPTPDAVDPDPVIEAAPEAAAPVAAK